MRFKISIIIIASILALTAFASLVMASDPLEKDEAFLNRDPDRDTVPNWEEFWVGTDPYNSDSDNDGLPDWFELEYSQWRNPDHNALMDPTDSSDAHLDFDFDPKSNGTQGERDAEFKAVLNLKDGRDMVWPSDPSFKFITILPHEDSKHYDNYEEYFRPYTQVEDGKPDVIRYMHTNPTDEDTDGDLFLDPDDFEPLGWRNDGLSPGGNDGPENPGHTEVKKPNTVDNKPIKEPLIEPIVPTNNEIFEIEIEQSTSEPKQKSNNDKGKYPQDIDNDGI